MELDISKRDRQIEGASKWRNARGIGALDWTPRFGKTFGSIEFIINPHLNVSTDNCVIVVVPSEIVSKQWMDNLSSYCNDLSRVAVYTINYFASNPDFSVECSLLVVDEIQKFLTPERKSVIDGTRIKTHYRLALTGTYPYDTEWICQLYPVVDKITEQEAISNGWISPYFEYNILLELPVVDKARYEKFSKPISETLALFKPVLNMLVRENNQRIFDTEFDLAYACYKGFKTVSLQGNDIYVTYDRLCNSIAFMMGWSTSLDVSIPANEELNRLWSPNSIHNRAKIFIDYVKKRNDVLINNPVKLEMVAEIISRNLVSTIVFNESTEFADKVADYINARFGSIYTATCYHSKIDSRTMIDPTTGDYFKFTTGERKGLPKMLGKDSIKKIVIEGFKHGFYNCLSTARALDEGLDVPSIEQVICTGGTTNPMTYKQRTARGKTIDYGNPDKITMIFNLVFDDFVNSNGEEIKSRDKTKLVLRQKQSGASIQWIRKLDDINFSASA